jgi:hypothetical protein
MNFMVSIDIKKLPEPINYPDKILLLGSCFTEHIGNALQDLKFRVMQNPNGILFDPASVCDSLISYIDNRQYIDKDLFYLNDVWHSWAHHSRFSQMKKEDVLDQINSSQQKAHTFLKDADWIIITLGSAFSYQLSEHATNTNMLQENGRVANCHRAPAQWFNKDLLEIDEIVSMLDNCYHRLLKFNPKLNIIFTVSPVRHIRDGVIENNRSKARLLESVHYMVNKFDSLHYFPAYELVIDVLRDYRFYDVDLAHPNYMATEFVLEKFTESCMSSASQELMQEIKKIVIARKHKAFQPNTPAHQQFLMIHLEKVKKLQEKHSFLDLGEELNYFKSITVEK